MAKFKDGDIVGLNSQGANNPHYDLSLVCCIDGIDEDFYYIEPLIDTDTNEYRIEIIDFDQMYELLPLGKLLYD